MTMKLIAMVLLGCVFGGGVAAESVTLPWSEFSDIYREHIERQTDWIEDEPEETRSVLSSATYSVTVADAVATVADIDITITGNIVSGEATIVPLFAADVAVTRSEQTKHGMLLVDGDSIGFLPRGGEPFSIQLSVRVAVREDERSKFVQLSLPDCVQNAVSLSLPPELTPLRGAAPTVDAPLYLAAGEPLQLRFSAAAGKRADSPPEVDLLTQISKPDKRLFVTSHFSVPPGGSPPFVLAPTPGAVIDTSLRSSWIERVGSDALRISLPETATGPFYVQFAVPSPDDAAVSVQLPAVAGNTGIQGGWIIDQPDDAELAVEGDGLAHDRPTRRLPQALLAAVGNPVAMSVSDDSPLNVHVRPFAAVDTPEIVLDSVYLFTAFEENGRALSVLRCTVPADAGQRLMIRRIKGASIWHYKVNDRKRKVFSLNDEHWMLPLDRGKESTIELAVLQTSEKFGLHGKVEIIVPETGLPARDLFVAVGLPERVDLIGIEGPLNPAEGKNWKLPGEFAGRPYFFSRSFYTGESMSAAISYKEPVEQTK
jgi:hypothetical protein